MKQLKWILDANGLAVPCDDLGQWGRWFGNEREKWHLVDEVEGIRISTVFLGIDHSFGKGEPVLWETMAFGPDIEEQWRMGITYWEARDFHRGLVAGYTERFKRTDVPNSFVEPRRTP